MNSNIKKAKKGENIYLVTGLGGSGKTTFAKRLAEKYGCKVLNLDSFKFGEN